MPLLRPQPGAGTTVSARWTLAASVVLLAVLSHVALPRRADAWQTHIGVHGYEDSAYAVTVDRDGNVVAGGVTGRSGDHGMSTVAKFATDGALLWSTLVDPWGSRARSVHADPAGDVLVDGLAGGQDESILGWFTAVKLAGTDGHEIWRYAPTESVDGAMVVDGAGDAIVSVVDYDPLDEIGDGITITCRKLAGSDGAIVWTNADCAYVSAVDEHGDVYARGPYSDVIKISGATGAELWRTQMQPPSFSTPDATATIDPAGDLVLAVGDVVTKLAGATGALAWRRVIGGLDGPLGWIRDVTTDASGDVVIGGTTLFTPRGGTKFLVAKLAGADGGELWRRALNARVRGISVDVARALAVDRDGDVYAGGDFDVARGGRIAVVKFKGRNGRRRWIRHLDGRGGVCRGLALDGSGNVALAGGMAPPTPDDGPSFVVARLGANGGDRTPLRVY